MSHTRTQTLPLNNLLFLKLCNLYINIPRHKNNTVAQAHLVLQRHTRTAYTANVVRHNRTLKLKVVGAQTAAKEKYRIKSYSRTFVNNRVST